jgi:hypothetical protein
MPTLYVMRDSTGPWPVVWREPEPPQEEPGRTWDYLGEVEEAEAARALETLHRRREAGEL